MLRRASLVKSGIWSLEQFILVQNVVAYSSLRSYGYVKEHVGSFFSYDSILTIHSDLSIQGRQ